MCADFDDTSIPLEENSEQENVGVVESLKNLPDDLYALPDAKAARQYQPVQQSEIVIREKMLKGVRSWGWTAIVLGVVHFVFGGFLNPSWGVTLILVGGLSFFIRESPMYVVYAITMLWVGISNLISGGLGGWTLMGLMQLFWAYGLFRNYRFYQKVEKSYWELPEENREPEEKKDLRANRLFPGVGCAIGSLSAFGGIAVVIFMLLVFAAAWNAGNEPSQGVQTLINWLWAVMLSGGIIGFSLGVAALLSGYPRKWMAWIAVISGFFVMAGHYYLIYG